MEFAAHAVTTVNRPEAHRVISDRNNVLRVDGRILVSLIEDDRLRVFDVDILLAGDQRPVASFPLLGNGRHSVTTGLSWTSPTSTDRSTGDDAQRGYRGLSGHHARTG
jgi:hypothetical protein